MNSIKKILKEESISLVTKILITELRDGVFNLIKSKTEEIDGEPWPDYIIKDMLYGTFKNDSHHRSVEFLEEIIEGIVNDYPNRKWELDTIEIKMSIFDEFTKKQLKERKPKDGVSANPNKVPKDKERHYKQKELIQAKGPSKEPIILIKTHNGKYNLLEGWHRTIQTLDTFPNGYEQNAWIYRY